jgi:thioredoxin 1
MAVRRVTSATFRREVLESDRRVVVDFLADWCGPCKMVSPALEALSREHDGEVKFVKVDIDRDPKLARAYRIASIPAVLLFEGGEVKAWSIGAKPGYVIERELGLARRKTSRPSRGRGLRGRVRDWLGRT